MKQYFAIFLFIWSYDGIHLLAQENQQIRPIGLEDLGQIHDMQKVFNKKEKAQRSPASVSPMGDVTPFAYGVCRGPNGRFYHQNHPDYAYCLNNDSRFRRTTEFSGKAVGFGLLFK